MRRRCSNNSYKVLFFAESETVKHRLIICRRDDATNVKVALPDARVQETLAFPILRAEEFACDLITKPNPAKQLLRDTVGIEVVPRRDSRKKPKDLQVLYAIC